MLRAQKAEVSLGLCVVRGGGDGPWSFLVSVSSYGKWDGDSDNLKSALPTDSPGQCPAEGRCPLNLGPCLGDLFVPDRADQPPSGREGRARPTDFLWLLQKQQNQKYYKTTPCICGLPRAAARKGGSCLLGSVPCG